MISCNATKATTTTGISYTNNLTTDATATISISPPYFNDINDLFSKKQTAVTASSLTIGKQEMNRLLIKDPDQIIDIVEYVPEKVYKIVFKDKTEIKTIKDQFDDFNPKFMLYLALAKKLYSKTLTFDGVMLKTYQLMNEKYYVKVVKKGLKLFNTLQEEKKKKEEYDEMKKRQREKNIRKKKAAKERKRQEQINIIAEAIRLSKEEG